MIYRPSELTLTDSIHTHFPISYRKKNNVPVQFTINSDSIEILAYLSFSRKLLTTYNNRRLKKNESSQEDLYLKTKDHSFTYADAIIEGIKKNWEGFYKFPWFNNSSDNKVSVRLTIIREDDKNKPDFVTSEQRYAKIRFAPFLSPSSFVRSPLWRCVWGVFSAKSLEGIGLNWSPYHPGSIYLKQYRDLASFEQVAAHEFGHLLGIGDAYDAWYRFGYEYPNSSSFMMCYNHRVNPMEIEMALNAHLTSKMQYFPYEKNFKKLIKSFISFVK